MRSQPPDLRLARWLYLLAAAVSALVFGLLAAMRTVRVPLPAGWSTAFLPDIYSVTNLGVAVLLVAALRFIRRGNVRAHRAAVQAALVGSLLFLVMYTVYHLTSEPRHFEGGGALRVIYLIMLASHVILAALSFPLILLTWIFGTTRQFVRHRRIARWVWPLWLYVAVTGPLCWLMLAFR